MIEEKRDVQPQREPLLGTQEHDAEEAVDGVFWQHQLRREQRHRPESEGGKVTPASVAARFCPDAASDTLVTQRPSSREQRSRHPGTGIHLR